MHKSESFRPLPRSLGGLTPNKNYGRLMNELFPSPFEVTGVSYPMTSTFFKNPLFAFPSPLEVTEGSYLNNVQLIGRTTAVFVPSRGEWELLLNLRRTLICQKLSFRPLSR